MRRHQVFFIASVYIGAIFNGIIRVTDIQTDRLERSQKTPLTVVDKLVVYPEAAATLQLLGAVRVEADHEHVGHGNDEMRQPIDILPAVATVKRYRQQILNGFERPSIDVDVVRLTPSQFDQHLIITV